MNASSTRRLEQEQLRRITMKRRIAQAQHRARGPRCPICNGGLASLLADVRAAREELLPGIAATSGCDKDVKH